MIKSPKFLAFVAATAAIGGYTGQVAWSTSSHQHLLQTTQKHRLQFSPGSADEILLDTLKTGDILLFSRRWYYYHLPQALYILIYQNVFDTEYDHVGICVCDKYGEPAILENTFWGGFKLRPFNERIVHSRSHQISLLTLQPREDDVPKDLIPAHRTGPRPLRSKLVPAEVRNAALRADVESLLKMHKTAEQVFEKPERVEKLSTLSGGGLSEICALLLGDGCYNMQLLRAVYKAMGLDVELNDMSSAANVAHKLAPHDPASAPPSSSGLSAATSNTAINGSASSHKWPHFASCASLVTGAVTLIDRAYREGALTTPRSLSPRIVNTSSNRCDQIYQIYENLQKKLNKYSNIDTFPVKPYPIILHCICKARADSNTQSGNDLTIVFENSDFICLTLTSDLRHFALNENCSIKLHCMTHQDIASLYPSRAF